MAALRSRKHLPASELLEAARVYGHQRTHCPNCGQWHELAQSLWPATAFERATDSSAHLKHYPDCHNRCAERGFAPAIKIEEV